MVAWAHEGYPCSHFPPFGFSGRFLFSPDPFYRMLLFSRTLSSIHTYHVGQLTDSSCVEVHHPINHFQANCHFGTDQEFWPTKL